MSDEGCCAYKSCSFVFNTCCITLMLGVSDILHVKGHTTYDQTFGAFLERLCELPSISDFITKVVCPAVVDPLSRRMFGEGSSGCACQDMKRADEADHTAATVIWAWRSVDLRPYRTNGLLQLQVLFSL